MFRSTTDEQFGSLSRVWSKRASHMDNVDCCAQHKAPRHKVKNWIKEKILLNKSRSSKDTKHRCAPHDPDSHKYAYVGYVENLPEDDDPEADNTDSSTQSYTAYAIGIEDDAPGPYKYGEEEEEMEGNPFGTIEVKDDTIEENKHDEKDEIQHNEEEEMYEISFEAESLANKNLEALPEGCDKKMKKQITPDERTLLANHIEQMHEHECQMMIIQQENLELRREVAGLHHMSESFCQGITSLWLENTKTRQELADLWQEKSKLAMMIEDLQRENNDGTTISSKPNKNPYHLGEHCEKHEGLDRGLFLEHNARVYSPRGNTKPGILGPAPNWLSPFGGKHIENLHGLGNMIQYGMIPIINLPKPEPCEDVSSSSHTRWQKSSHCGSEYSIGEKETQFPVEIGETSRKGKEKLEDVKRCTVSIRTDALTEKTHVSLTERKKRLYSFRKDKTPEVFDIAIQHGLLLPKCKYPEEQYRYDEPDFCLFHRFLGHTIEECFSFKDWAEKKFLQGDLPLPRHLLQIPSPHT